MKNRSFSTLSDFERNQIKEGRATFLTLASCFLIIILCFLWAGLDDTQVKAPEPSAIITR